MAENNLADTLEIGNGHAVLSALTSTFPDLEGKVINQFLMDQLNAPVNNIIKGMFTDVIGQRVNSVVSHAAKNRIAITLPDKLANMEEETLFAEAYPEFNISYSYSNRNPHAIAANSRRLELRLMLHRVGYTKDHAVNQNYITDDFICDIGGNYATHWLASHRGIHSCCPILSEYDDLRSTTRLDTVMRSVMQRYPMTEWQKTTIQTIQHYANNRQFAQPPELFCTNPAQDCTRTAVYGIMCHSNYDIPLRQLADIMTRKNIKIVHGSFIYTSDILFTSEGTMKPLGVHFKYSSDKRRLRFSFTGDSSLTYTHDVATYFSYLVVSIFYDSTMSHKFFLELLENRMGIQYFKVSKGKFSLINNIRLNHSLWFKDADKKVVVKFLNLSVLTPKFIHLLSLENFRTDFSHEEYLIFDKELVEAGMSFALGATEEKFRPVDIYNYLRTQNRRVIFAQKDILGITKKEDSQRVFKLSYAIYLHVYSMKYSYGRINQKILADIKSSREFHRKSLWEKFWGPKQNKDNLVRVVIPGLHRAVYNWRKEQMFEVELTDHIEFIEFDSFSKSPRYRKFLATIIKFKNIWASKYYSPKIIGDTFNIPEIFSNMLVFDIKEVMPKVFKDQFGLDIQFDKAPMTNLEAKERYFEKHGHCATDEMSEISSVSGTSWGSNQSITPNDNTVGLPKLKKPHVTKRDGNRVVSMLKDFLTGVYDAEGDQSQWALRNVPEYRMTEKPKKNKSRKDLVEEVEVGSEVESLDTYFSRNAPPSVKIVELPEQNVRAEKPSTLPIYKNFKYGVEGLREVAREVARIGLSSLELIIMELINGTELPIYNYSKGQIKLYFSEGSIAEIVKFFDILESELAYKARVLKVGMIITRTSFECIRATVLPIMYKFVKTELKQYEVPDVKFVECGGKTYKLIKCLGDGKCLFYALNKASTNIQRMVDTMRAYDPSHLDLIDLNSLHQELNFQEWGGFQTMLVFSAVFKKRICVHSQKPHECIKVGMAGETLHLYYNGIHYDYLELVEDWSKEFVKDTVVLLPESSVEEPRKSTVLVKTSNSKVQRDSVSEVESILNAIFETVTSPPIRTPKEISVVSVKNAITEVSSDDDEHSTTSSFKSVASLTPTNAVSEHSVKVPPTRVIEVTRPTELGILCSPVSKVKTPELEVFDNAMTEIERTAFIRRALPSESEYSSIPMLSSTSNRLVAGNFVIYVCHDHQGNYTGFTSSVLSDGGQELLESLNSAKLKRRLYKDCLFFGYGKNFRTSVGIVTTGSRTRYSFGSFLEFLCEEVDNKYHIIVDAVAFGTNRWDNSMERFIRLINKQFFKTVKFRFSTTNSALQALCSDYGSLGLSDSDVSIASMKGIGSDLVRYLNAFKDPVSTRVLYRQLIDNCILDPSIVKNYKAFMVLLRNLTSVITLNNIDGQEYAISTIKTRAGQGVTDMVQEQKQQKVLKPVGKIQKCPDVISKVANTFKDAVVTTVDTLESVFFGNEMMKTYCEQLIKLFPDVTLYDGHKRLYTNVFIDKISFRRLNMDEIEIIYLLVTSDDLYFERAPYIRDFQMSFLVLPRMVNSDCIILKLTKVEKESIVYIPQNDIINVLDKVSTHRLACRFCKHDILGKNITEDEYGVIYACNRTVGVITDYCEEAPAGASVLSFRRKVANDKSDADIIVRQLDDIYYITATVHYSDRTTIKKASIDIIITKVRETILFYNISRMAVNILHEGNLDTMFKEFANVLEELYIVRDQLLTAGKILELEDHIRTSTGDVVKFLPGYQNECSDLRGSCYRNCMLEFKEMCRVTYDCLARGIRSHHIAAMRMVHANGSFDAGVQISDASFGMLDYHTRRWVYKPKDEASSYMVFYDGSKIVTNMYNIKRKVHDPLTQIEVITEGRYLSVNREFKVCNAESLNYVLPKLDVDYFVKEKINMVLNLGVPGAGKSLSILNRVDNGVIMNGYEYYKEDGRDKRRQGDLILTTTAAAAVELRQKYKARAVGKVSENYDDFLEKKIRTGDSFLIHGVQAEVSDTIWIDEGLMKHAGDLLYCVVKAKSKNVHIYGDQAQIPYICRNRDYTVVRSSLIGLEKIRVEHMQTSYRCPRDVIAKFQINNYYPFKIYTVSNLTATMKYIVIGSLSDVPKNLPDTVYLTYMQSEKLTMQGEHYHPVHSVHEYQGNQSKNIVLVRLDPKEFPVHDSNNHLVVALSRHTKNFIYYTIKRSDNVTKFIDMPVITAEMNAVHSSRAGYCPEDVCTSPWEPYGDIEIQNAVAIKTYTESKVLRNLVEKHGFPNVQPAKYQRKMIDDVEVPEAPFYTQIEGADYTILQELIDIVYPRSSRYDSTYDNADIEIQDWYINVCDFQYRENFLPKLRQRTCLRSRIESAIQPKVPNSIKQLLKAFSERNGNVPDFLGERDIDTLLINGMKRFEDTYISDKKVYYDFRNEEITPNTRDTLLWAMGQIKDILPAIDADDSTVYIKELTRYTYIMKGTTKPVLDDSAGFKIVSPQTIAFHDKLVNAIFCPIVREMKSRFLAVLKSRFAIFTDLSMDDFVNKLNVILPPSRLQQYPHSLEVDFSKYDKSQELFARLFEDTIMKNLGFPLELLPYWHWAHIFTDLVNLDLKFKAKVSYQRKSGDAMTFFGNTMYLMFVMAYVYDLDKAVALFAGDDSYVFTSSEIGTIDDCTKFSSLFNLEAKLLKFNFPYFCSKFLLPVDDQNWLMVPDVVKMVVKLGRRDLVDWQHVEEYRVSLADLIKPFKNFFNNDVISLAMRDRYAIDFDMDLILATLVKYIDSPDKFREIFYLNDGDILLLDPSRPSLEI